MSKIFAIAALLCLSLSAGSLPTSRQFSITISQPAQVGSVKLAPGDYKLKIDATNAIFIDSHRKEFSAPVKIEKTAKKAPTTAIETKEVNGAQEITCIDLGGADFRLLF